MAGGKFQNGLKKNSRIRKKKILNRNFEREIGKDKNIIGAKVKGNKDA